MCFIKRNQRNIMRNPEIKAKKSSPYKYNALQLTAIITLFVHKNYNEKPFAAEETVTERLMKLNKSS